MARWTQDDLPDLSGRRAVVTGATSGLGLVTARELARHGADVVLAVRNTAAGEEVADRIRRHARGDVAVERLDLASLTSVRDFAHRFEGPLDLLVNNAGVMVPPRYRETEDGFEPRFGTNHLGHFALTGLLLPHLLAAPAARVTTVSSLAHASSDAAVCEGSPEATYSPPAAYARSKLANLLFADELQRRAAAAGVPLTSTAAHPGISATNLFSSADGIGSIPLAGTVVRLGLRLTFPGPVKGAQAILHAATVADPGSYTGPTWLGEARGPVGPAARSGWARDSTLAGLLWERSEELTGVTYRF